nr:DNA repair protein RadC [Cohnella thermotolerans]
MKMLKRVMQNETPHRITRPLDVYRLSLDLVSVYQEHFVVYFLNTKNRVIGRQTLSIGSLNASVVHPREVFRAAIQQCSASIICVHNHPSGDPTPSPQDIEVTHKLVEAGRIIGIDVLDHVIVARDGYVSLKERGLI